MTPTQKFKVGDAVTIYMYRTDFLAFVTRAILPNPSEITYYDEDGTFVRKLTNTEFTYDVYCPELAKTGIGAFMMVRELALRAATPDDLARELAR